MKKKEAFQKEMENALNMCNLLSTESENKRYVIQLIDAIKKIKDVPVTATTGMIRYTIDIPQSLLAQGRTFAIFREHDGIIAKLADLDDNPATYTFETNVYSTYVLGYQDEEPAPVTVPKTGDTATVSYTHLRR